MSRKHSSLSKPLVAAAALALTASGAAFADDNSMSRLTGDSYAYFNNLDYSPGNFNMARAPRTQEQDAVTATPRKAPAKIEQRILLAGRTAKVTPPNPFRDDTGA